MRGLTVAEAQQKLPVRLRGVVTFFDEELYSRFLQDDTAGIYLQYSTNTPALVSGQVIEVEGTTSPGEYAPIVVPDRVRVVGQGPLPPPKAVAYEQLAGGKEDSQFVEIVGVVRRVQRNEASQYHLLEIATGGGRMSVYAPQLPVERTEELLDSSVRVRGVCATQFNHQRQLFAIRLLVPHPGDVEIELPAPPEPFAAKARPIGSLLQFEPRETYGHRIKVSGTVILYEAGKRFFLQDGQQGVEVQTKAREPLQLGDRVEALGFVSQGEGRDAFADLENGSRVAVTGVCRIDPGEWLAGEDWRAKSFRVQLRSPADVRVLKAPPWLSLRRVLWLAAGVALVAFSWVVVLRRQVAERTRQLETQIQQRQRAERQHFIEQERARVAQDLHDELGATLTEVGMLGTLARTPALPLADRERYLDKLTQAARAVVATLDEIVWAVNPQYDSVASLASYYSMFAQRFLNLAGLACRLEVADNIPATPLDSRSRHGVFLAFKEALNNAVRHSGASLVRIEMVAAGRQLKIAVTDNGRGFLPAQSPPGSDGLASMQARLPKLGGRCEIISQPGQGTTVEFWLPLEDHAP